MTTARQKAAVRFCEDWLHIKFSGDLEDRTEVSYFISENLDEAKNIYEEVRIEYESYLWDLMD